jgi:hypothetical protein
MRGTARPGKDGIDPLKIQGNGPQPALIDITTTTAQLAF